jgi:hypothetical protein
MSFIQGILPGPRLPENFRGKDILYELLAPRSTTRLEDHHLSAYSIYSQLPSVPGGHLLHPQRIGLIWLRIGTSGGLL